MQEKYLIIPNNKDLTKFKSFNTFILPLEDYSIGFDVYFNIQQINKLSKEYSIYVIINKFIHKTTSSFKNIYEKLDSSIKFIIEDIGLTSIIPKNRTVLYESHILCNYKAINYLNTLGYSSVVINNDLTINEIEEILNKCNSDLYYFYINRNILLYSRRHLVSNYNKYYNLEDSSSYNIVEDVSKKKMIIKEESDGTTISNDKLFIANKYMDVINKINHLIINTSSMSDLELDVVLKYYDSEKLCNIIDADYYFLENDIKYKVGDIK